MTEGSKAGMTEVSKAGMTEVSNALIRPDPSEKKGERPTRRLPVSWAWIKTSLRIEKTDNRRYNSPSTIHNNFHGSGT